MPCSVPCASTHPLYENPFSLEALYTIRNKGICHLNAVIPMNYNSTESANPTVHSVIFSMVKDICCFGLDCAYIGFSHSLRISLFGLSTYRYMSRWAASSEIDWSLSLINYEYSSSSCTKHPTVSKLSSFVAKSCMFSAIDFNVCSLWRQ